MRKKVDVPGKKILIIFFIIFFFPMYSSAMNIRLEPLKVVNEEKDNTSSQDKAPPRTDFFDFRTLNTHPDEKSVLNITVNDENKGDFFVRLTDKGDVLFQQIDIKRLGFMEIPAQTVLPETGEVSLKAFSPEVLFKIDEKAPALIISTNPRLLEKKRISFVQEKSRNIIRTKDNSAFVNYSVNYSIDDKSSREVLNIPLETGIRLGEFFVFSDFSYSKNDTDQDFVRQMSSITRDDPMNLRRYIIGDFSANSGSLGSTGIFGGLSISRNFSMSPYFIRFPRPELSGLIRSPSEAELYVDDILVRKEYLSPGTFEFFNLPVTTGAGDIRVLIRDSFGREEEITYPFYTSSNLLSPGLHEYSYNLGFKREDFGEESFEYSDPAFIGFHRIGLLDRLTTGLRAEADKDIINIGPTAAFIIGSAGEISTAIAISRDNNRYGYGGVLDYVYSGRHFSTRTSLKHYSEDYANLSLSAEDDKTRFYGHFSLGFHQKEFGSLTGSFSYTDRYENSDRNTATISYDRLLYRNIWLRMTAARMDYTEDTVYEFFAGLNFTFGNNHSVNLNSQTRDGQTDLSANLYKDSPGGTGYGYRLSLENQDIEDDNNISGNTSLRYNGPYGIYTGSFYKDENRNRYNMKTAGSITLIDKGIHFSRPVHDSFALVKVGNIEGVTVKHSNTEIGRTDSNGKLIVPELISYYDNKVSIDLSDIPLGHSIQETEKHLSPSYRSGSVAEFSVTKLRTFEGRIFILENGEKIPAEYVSMEIITGDQKIESVTGTDGAFYLENFSSGIFSARLFYNNREYRFDLNIPETDQISVDMGDIICETIISK